MSIAAGIIGVVFGGWLFHYAHSGQRAELAALGGGMVFLGALVASMGFLLPASF